MHKFNYTKRQKIDRADIAITTYRDDNNLCFQVLDLDLEEYKFPKEAHIFIEAKRLSSQMLFSLGTISSPELTPEQNALIEFHDPTEILFRIKIVEPGTGLLLGEADTLSAQLPDADENGPGDSLLPVMSENLKDMVWRLNMADNGPILIINEKYIKSDVSTSDSFKALVFPQIIHQIFTHIYFVEKQTFDETDTDYWIHAWYRLATEEIADQTLPPATDSDAEDINDWISKATFAFAKRFNCNHLYMKHVEG